MAKMSIKYNNIPEGFPEAILKKLSYEICYPLSIIYTHILESGTCYLEKVFHYTYI